MFREALVEKKTDAAKLDDATSELVSEVQALLDKPEGTFRPERAQDVEGAAVVVENVDDKEYMMLKKKYGAKVGTEIQRAYREMQQYGNMVRGRNVIPWDSKKKRPLAIDQLVTMLAVQIFDDLSAAKEALAEEETTDTKENERLHKRMKYTAENQEDLLKHNTAGTNAQNRGC